jgi:ribose-phosphate pyrophosphokinase
MELKISKYPDGSSYVVVQGFNAITHRVNTYEDLWHLNQIVDAYNSCGVRPDITIPCLIDAQADQRFNDCESFGLKLVLDFLAGMDANFTIFHPHNAGIVKFALPDAVILDNTDFVRRCLQDIGVNRKNMSENVLMSPDAGAFKTVIKLANDIDWMGETFSASKSRSWDGAESKLVQVIDRQDFGGKDVIIVDDLCVYGGTFKGLAKLLRERNVRSLYLIVSHITVKDLGNDPVTNYFDNVYTTNSKYDFHTCQDATGTKFPSNLKVIELF